MAEIARAWHSNITDSTLKANMTTTREARIQYSHIAAMTATIAATGVGSPKIVMKPVIDADILGRGTLFTEANRQTQPIVHPDSSNLPRIVEIVKDSTARANGIGTTVAEKYVTRQRTIEELFLSGVNQVGKAAEVVVARDYIDLHNGVETGIVNPPANIADNVMDIRLAPDPTSRKDLIFAFETKKGNIIWKHNGQVKVGGAQYVSDSLCEMANTPGYGKVGYLDAKFVNEDGTPRVGPGAFTAAQAQRLQDAKVKLRGIPDLERRACELLEDLESAKEDGLDPVAREQLGALRIDIDSAYKMRALAVRAAWSIGVGATLAAGFSILKQHATDGEVEFEPVLHAAVQAADNGVALVLAEAALYKIAIKILKALPENAKNFAQQGVPIVFALIAVATDISEEVEAAINGEISMHDVVTGIAAKTALNVLPLLTPQIIAGSIQFCGRVLINRTREQENQLKVAIQHDRAVVRNLKMEMDEYSEKISKISNAFDETDELFRRMMSIQPSANQTRESLAA